METIFDYHPTKQELYRILGLENATKEWYLDMYIPSVFKWHLCSLFYARKDKKNFNIWIEKFDYLSQLDFYRVVNHP